MDGSDSAIVSPQMSPTREPVLCGSCSELSSATHGFKTSVAQPLFFIKKRLEYNYSRVTTPVSIVVGYFLVFLFRDKKVMF